MLKNIKSEMDFNPFTLIFNNKEREKEYTYFRYLHKSGFLRKFLLVFTLVYLAIFIADFFLTEVESYILISIKTTISIIGLLFYFIIPKVKFNKQFIFIVIFISLIYVSIIFQAIFFPGVKNVNVYMIGFSIVVYITYVLVGLKLKDSFIINFIAQTVFYSLLIYSYPEQANIIVYALLFQVNFVFLYSAYHIEISNRQLFFYINKLELENEKQMKLYSVLEKSKMENTELNYESDIDSFSEESLNIIKQRSSKNNILIVDDEKDNMLYFEQVALKLRLNLYKAKNGLDAVNIFKKNKEDIALVLMDIRMPEMNGYLATSEIKKINKDVPVILISAYSSEIKSDNEADLVLLKPITPKDLMIALKKFID